MMRKLSLKLECIYYTLETDGRAEKSVVLRTIIVTFCHFESFRLGICAISYSHLSP